MSNAIRGILMRARRRLWWEIDANRAKLEGTRQFVARRPEECWRLETPEAQRRALAKRLAGLGDSIQVFNRNTEGRAVENDS